MDLSLNLEGTHVVITGAAGYIGSVTVAAFLTAGANVSALDINPSKLIANLSSDFGTATATRSLSTSAEYLASHPNLYVLPPSDVTSESSLSSAFELARQKFGPVQCCVALASLDLSVLEHHGSLVDMSVEQWRKTSQVNVEGTFLTAREWLRGVKVQVVEGTPERDEKEEWNLSLIIVGSESGWFGERGNADYSAGKSAVQVGLLQSLRGDVVRVHPRARVNAIAPGAVDTAQFRRECEANPEQYWLDAQATTAQKRPIPVEAVAKCILFLASESWSGHIHGQVLNVDGGKMGKLMWTKDEIL
ncbi:NAD-P-binding protein [Stereum hirsutum FP-91666 SS1]|uniref:NAD-P-binding protein n=1 Tax=Stereum hirsutum (strain FP-91666) TaxID=721885 RepID=R7RYV8_STEHR|nr:NAD-P-binding protein [Stereum hirsutum FP-91666 SS1]EIM80013.1 NAD-P-binding protein [Stereum hirsutum FP-91666 SS1]